MKFILICGAQQHTKRWNHFQPFLKGRNSKNYKYVARNNIQNCGFILKSNKCEFFLYISKGLKLTKRVQLCVCFRKMIYPYIIQLQNIQLCNLHNRIPYICFFLAEKINHVDIYSCCVFVEKLKGKSLAKHKQVKKVQK